MRHGHLRWNGEVDEYLVSMNPSIEDTFKKSIQLKTRIDIPLDQALKYLNGQSIVPDSKLEIPLTHGETGIFTWNHLPLGPFKFVGDRFNNLLPKPMRTSGQSSIDSE